LFPKIGLALDMFLKGNRVIKLYFGGKNMKNKIIGIILCMLIFSPVLPVASAMNFQTLWCLKNNSNSIPYITTDSSKITVKIVATITEVQDSNTLLGGAIHVNDTITGKYVYDTGVADSEPDPNYGSYLYTSSPYGFEVKVGNFDFKSDPNNVYFAIGIINDWSMYGSPPRDDFSLGSLNNLPLSNGLLVTSLEWDLTDTTATALSSDALPTTAPVLADWNSGQGVFIEGHSPSHPSQTFRIFAHVTEATKRNAINIFGTESGTPSTILPNHYNIPFMQFWITILERFPNAISILHNLLSR